MSAVPCNGCTACCKQDVIVLGVNDNLAAYAWHTEGRLRVLNRKANGECFYLDEKGCSIHGAAPSICRQFDCRELVKKTRPEQQVIRIEQNSSMREVYAAGRSRLNTLEA